MKMHYLEEKLPLEDEYERYKELIEPLADKGEITITDQHHYRGKRGKHIKRKLLSITRRFISTYTDEDADVPKKRLKSRKFKIEKHTQSALEKALENFEKAREKRER